MTVVEQITEIVCTLPAKEQGLALALIQCLVSKPGPAKNQTLPEAKKAPETVRTIDGAYEYFHDQDPDTALTKNAIRQMVVSGKVPSTKAGNKYLIKMAALEKYLKGG
jgi:excisionase family DNA binding protein